MNNKKGFTLAEVMITLATLGVIAAILIPAITSLAPDRNKVMFKKAYYSLEQAISQLINDEVHYPSGSTWSSSGGPAECKNGSIYVNCSFYNTTATSDIPVAYKNNKFCYLLQQELNILKTDVACSRPDTTIPAQFTTSDGITWFVYDMYGFPIPAPAATTYTTSIVFDVDNDNTTGCGNVTNAEACAAGKTPDRYQITIDYDGTLRVQDAAGKAILSNPFKNTK